MVFLIKKNRRPREQAIQVGVCEGKAPGRSRGLKQNKTNILNCAKKQNREAYYRAIEVFRVNDFIN